jgi:hypothetical protein
MPGVKYCSTVLSSTTSRFDFVTMMYYNILKIIYESVVEYCPIYNLFN